MRRAVPRDDFRGHDDVLKDFPFGRLYVVGRLRGGVGQEIDIGRGAEFDRGETLIEMAGPFEAVDHILGNRRAGFVMQGETL